MAAFVQAIEGDKLGVSFDDPVSIGNVVVACPVKSNDRDTYSVDPRQGGACPVDTNMTQMVRGVNTNTNPGNDDGNNALGIQAKVAGDTYAGPFLTDAACDASAGRMVLIEFSGLGVDGYETASMNTGGFEPAEIPATIALGTYDDAEAMVVVVVWKDEDGFAVDPEVDPGEFTELHDAVTLDGRWAWVGYKLGGGDATITHVPFGLQQFAAAVVAFHAPSVTPEAWDVYAGDDLMGPIIATLENASERTIRVEEDGAGMGSFKINRHSTEATTEILKKGNLVRVRIPEISADYIGAFFLEQGDFEILASGEDGDEDLTFAGRGVLSYLARARMWNVAYSTGVENLDTWDLIWKTSSIPNPVGAAVVDDDPTFLYVISATKRKIYKIRQSDRKVVRTSPALWSGSDNFAGGLSADPADDTILWALEAPWSRGGSGNTKIRKVQISDWAILDTFNLGSAVKLTEVKASSTHLWTSRFENTNPIQKRSKADGSVVTGYDPSFSGNDLNDATGISYNATEDLLAYWFDGKDRAYIADPSAPATIIDRISTKGISPFGGDWTTEGADQFFYPVSYTADMVWKYQIVAGVPIDPVDGIWRLDEATPGAIAHRIVVEAQHASRPQQPIPDLVHDFDFDEDSDGNPWDSHPGTEEFTANVGDFVDETVLRLVPYGLTLQMNPNTMELEAYNESDFGRDLADDDFGPGVVRLVGTVNIAESLRRRLDDRLVDSHELVQYDNGYALAVDDDLGYVREGFLATSLRKAATAEGTGDAELARQRRDSDSQAVVIPWGDDVGVGLYLPGPAGSNGHYWVGDTIRVHSGAGNFDLVEQDREIKAITITELDAGGSVEDAAAATNDRRWVAIADLASVFLPIYDPTDPPRKASKRLGGSDGAGGGGTKTLRAEVRLRDTTTGESLLGKTLESDDWSIWRSGDGKVGVAIRRPRLDQVRDVEVGEVVDGQTIVWDAALEMWIPGDVAGAADTPIDHGTMGATETIDVSAGTWHRGTLDDDCAITVTGYTVDAAVIAVVKLTSDGTHAITWDPDVVAMGDDQAGDGITFFLLFTDEGDSTIYLAKVGGSTVAALDDLTDVVITSPATADRLRYDGSAWVNSPLIWKPVMDGLGNVVTDSGTGEAIMTEVVP